MPWTSSGNGRSTPPGSGKYASALTFYYSQLTTHCFTIYSFYSLLLATLTILLFTSDHDNFWLGNDKIHTITTSGSELRFDLTDDQGATAFAKYASFAIGDGSTWYKLAVSTYSGTAGDSFSAHNGYKFSTKDQDNDVASGSNCALIYHGAWWYNRCHSSNLNGLYHTPGPHASYADGVNWYAWKGRASDGYHNSLARTMMLVRPLECIQVPSGSYMYKGNELSGKVLCCPAGWYVSLSACGLRLGC